MIECHVSHNVIAPNGGVSRAGPGSSFREVERERPLPSSQVKNTETFNWRVNFSVRILYRNHLFNFVSADSVRGNACAIFDSREMLLPADVESTYSASVITLTRGLVTMFRIFKGEES
jgi:hypothetical protein